jgi:hypothetical protein
MKCLISTDVGCSSVRVEPLSLANSIDQRSWVTNRLGFNQGDPLSIRKVHYCIHKRPSFVSVLSYINLIRFNSIVPFISRSSKWFPSGLTTNTIPCILHSLPILSFSMWWIEYRIWWEVHIMNLLIMAFFTSFLFYLSLRYRFSPHHSVLRQEKSIVFPKQKRLSITRIEKKTSRISFYSTKFTIF